MEQVGKFFELRKQLHHPKTNDMTMENPPFEDVCPIENGYFPMSCFSGM